MLSWLVEDEIKFIDWHGFVITRCLCLSRAGTQTCADNES